MKPIVTSRLVLRNFMVSDAMHMLDYLSCPRANCFISEKIKTIEDATQKALEKSTDDSFIAICLKDHDRIIGELFYKYEEPDTYNIGWNIGSEYEGKGYARESANALFEHLFLEKLARRVYAYVEDDNYRSQRLCERLGMRKEGCFMEFVSFVYYPNGILKYENTMQYAILRKEWEIIANNNNKNL